MNKITKAQQLALFYIYYRKGWAAKPKSFLAFRRSAFLAWGGVVMVPFCGMWLGIETDGYTHS
jgi:hypothetical protein